MLNQQSKQQTESQDTQGQEQGWGCHFGSSQQQLLPFYLYCAITFPGLLLVLPLFPTRKMCKCCYNTYWIVTNAKKICESREVFRNVFRWGFLFLLKNCTVKTSQPATEFHTSSNIVTLNILVISTVCQELIVISKSFWKHFTLPKWLKSITKVKGSPILCWEPNLLSFALEFRRSPGSILTEKPK